MGYCMRQREPIPDWKGLGFAQLKPFLTNLANQNHIRFIGDHIAHPDNEAESVDIEDMDEAEMSDDDEEVLLNRAASTATVAHAKAISSPKLNKSGSFSGAANKTSNKLVNCPICQNFMPEDEVNSHLDECLNMQMLNNEQGDAANNTAGNNRAAVPVNNNNPNMLIFGAAVNRERSGLNLAASNDSVNTLSEGADDEGEALPRHTRGMKRRRSSNRVFVPNKRTRRRAMVEEEAEQEEADEGAMNNNNLPLNMTLVRQAQASQVHLSDDSEEENEDNGRGDSRFAEKVLDRTLADKECIICYEAMEQGQLVVTMPCFCQFHKCTCRVTSALIGTNLLTACLLGWFEKREVCPTHSEMSM